MARFRNLAVALEVFPHVAHHRPARFVQIEFLAERNVLRQRFISVVRIEQEALFVGFKNLAVHFVRHALPPSKSRFVFEYPYMD